jgi:hypothetical protein
VDGFQNNNRFHTWLRWLHHVSPDDIGEATQ